MRIIPFALLLFSCFSVSFNFISKDIKLKIATRAVFYCIFMCAAILIAKQNMPKQMPTKDITNNKSESLLTSVQRRLHPEQVLSKVINERERVIYGDDISASYFFAEIGDVAVDMIGEFGDNLKVLQVILNDKPSGPFRLNGDPKNDDQVFASFVGAHRKLRAEQTKIRWNNTRQILTSSKHSKAFSFYFQDGICQDTFIENCKKHNIHYKKFIDDKIFYHTVFKADESGAERAIKVNDKGQIWVFQDLRSKHFLIFREEAGEQAHYVGRGNAKYLHFDGLFASIKELKIYRNGVVYDIFKRFDLLKELK